MNGADGNASRRVFALDGRPCALFGDPGAACLLVQPTDADGLDALQARIGRRRAALRPSALLAFGVRDWNGELSPWRAPPVFGREGFGGGAAETLDWLERRLLPEVASGFGLADVPIVLGGYSLAALFALWAATRSDRYAGVAAASPSVWFPGWIDYARAEPTRARCVYLSLGDGEARTRNRALAAVGDCVRAQYALLRDAGVDCALEWNPGNHFRDVGARTARAFEWCADRLLAADLSNRKR